jgi:hypothetical protein
LNPEKIQGLYLKTVANVPSGREIYKLLRAMRKRRKTLPAPSSNIAGKILKITAIH